MYTRVRVYVYVCIHVSVYVDMCVHIDMYICMYIHGLRIWGIDLPGHLLAHKTSYSRSFGPWLWSPKTSFLSTVDVPGLMRVSEVRARI